MTGENRELARSIARAMLWEDAENGSIPVESIERVKERVRQQSSLLGASPVNPVTQELAAKLFLSHEFRVLEGIRGAFGVVNDIVRTSIPRWAIAPPDANQFALDDSDRILRLTPETLNSEAVTILTPEVEHRKDEGGNWSFWSWTPAAGPDSGILRVGDSRLTNTSSIEVTHAVRMVRSQESVAKWKFLTTASIRVGVLNLRVYLPRDAFTEAPQNPGAPPRKNRSS